MAKDGAGAPKRYRVAQWGTGHTGMRSLIGLIRHPHFELVGLRVYSEEKTGRDAGAICGLPDTGVKATRSIDDILAARPDCVAYMPLTDHFDVGDMARLLEAGINIATLVAEWHFRDTIDPEQKSALEAACERGGATLYATGPSPGVATEQIPFALLTMMRDFEHLLIHEFADMRPRSTPEMLQSMFGWKRGEQSVAHVAEHLRKNFGDSLRQTAAELGVPLEEVTASGDVACATEDVTLAGYTIRAGTVAAWQFETHGLRGGEPLISFRNTWFATRNLDTDWETRDTGWRWVTRGDAPMHVDLYFDREDFVATQPSFSANPVVNAIPQVCEARPGILHTAELPVIPPRFG